MKMVKNNLNLEMTRGDTLSFGVEIYSLGQSLTTAYFTCKNTYDAETSLFQKSIGNGISLDRIENEDYFYKVRIAPGDTENLEVGKYYYDMQIEANGDVFTILKGILTIDFDVTQGRTI